MSWMDWWIMGAT